MRQDQFEKLQQLHEKLMDVFLEEADPGAWPGHGLALVAMDQKTRGDRYWCKKNAVGTAALLQRVGGLADRVRERSADDVPGPESVTEPTEELDAEVAAAEKEAQRLLDEVQRGAAKAAFDKRVHGRP